MPRCAYCHSGFWFGGYSIGEDRYCSENCQAAGNLMQYAKHVPEQDVEDFIQRVHTGTCPQCQGPGPVDVHMAHSVYSILIMTSWQSTPQVCCRSCGVSSQGLALGKSLLLGWWGFPWGLLITPWQVSRNIWGMCFPPDPMQPSMKMQSVARVLLGQEVLRFAAQQQAEAQRQT